MKEPVAKLTRWTRQRRFKSIVEKAGFKLENGKQVTGGTPPTQNATAAIGAAPTGHGDSSQQAPKTPRKKAEPGSAAKRRKSNTGKAMKTKIGKEDEDTADEHDEKLDGGRAKVVDGDIA